MVDTKNRRGSDTQLVLLQHKLENHIQEFHEHCAEENKRWDRFIATQESNTETIRELVNSNKELTESTRDIILVWQAASGTMKTVSALGKLIKWLSGFAVIGVFFTWLANHLPDFLK